MKVFSHLVSVALLIGLFSPVWVLSQSTEHPQQKYDNWSEYERVRNRIFELSNARDLYGLLELQKEVEETWGKKQPIDIFKRNLYAGLMYEICSSFASQDFGTDERYSLARKCVREALKKRENMLVEQEVSLIPFSTTPEYFMKAFTEEQWQNDRKERAEYWFHAWQRLENEVDENYNFQVNRPKKISNLSPQERVKVETYARQYKLHQLKDSFSRQFKDLLIGNYTMLPYNNIELKSFLKKYVTDVELKNSILVEVEQKILEQNSQDK